MSEIIALETMTHGVRIWGFIASVFFFAGLARHWRNDAHARRWSFVASVLVGVFLLVAGGGLPLFNLVLGLAFDEPLIVAMMAAAWPAVSSAGWALAIAHARRPAVMTAAALLAFVVTQYAAFAQS